MLQTVHMKIIGSIWLDNIPPDKVVVLPNIETFSLVVSESEAGFIAATYISCPSMTLIRK